MLGNQPGAGDKTQVFSLSNSDATLPRLDIPEVTIGRDPKCEVFLNDRTVSRRHAHLSLQNGRAHIEDLGSLNGTWVDGAIVSQGDLHSGSTIQIGTFKMILNLH